MSKWRVERWTPRAWIARGPDGRGWSFYTWREAFDFADNWSRYGKLERQWLNAVAESKDAGRRGPEGWRS